MRVLTFLKQVPVLSLVGAFALLFFVIFGGMLAPYDPERVVTGALQSPSTEHWFGTDATGMDVFSRVMAGAQIDIALALVVTVVATVAGVVLGIVIGTFESRRGLAGMAGRGITRFLDLTDAVPPLVIGVVIVGLMGATLTSLSIALALIMSPVQARLTRAEVLKVRNDAYVEAGLMAGLRPMQVTFRHVLPNSMRPAIENCSTVFGFSVIVLASLGFLGVGLNPPTPEWGNMISSGVSGVMLGSWWPVLFPALALMLAVIAAAAVAGLLTRLSRGPAAR
ncbi:ABC transporter permease [Nocardioides bruguierae]|uniref:ABC transporter permease n=1 Tax=Nocardioides bruguierae TaxID=2945102 RepID=A0A9X2IG33_9ACTN|nr:ABC transporter permease [Nocardioides bruguierae]MCM0621144.1 ABC transporter permease [Nocardioides bruguierae]